MNNLSSDLIPTLYDNDNKYRKVCIFIMKPFKKLNHHYINIVSDYQYNELLKEPNIHLLYETSFSFVDILDQLFFNLLSFYFKNKVKSTNGLFYKLLIEESLYNLTNTINDLISILHNFFNEDKNLQEEIIIKEFKELISKINTINKNLHYIREK